MLSFTAFPWAQKRHAIALRSMLPLVSDDAPTTWIEAAFVGTWEGHPSGPFEFTLDTFKQIIANFEAQANPVPLTYEHPAHSGDGQPIPAAGWVHELKIEGESLMALVEFTPRAAQMVKDGEYRFSSVVVDFEATDRETGETRGAELYELAITNTPFLDGQRPIKLSRRVSAGRTRMNERELIDAALAELGDKATTDAIAKWVEGRKMQLAALDGDKAAKATEETAEDVAASEEPAETVEASAEPGDVVEATDVTANMDPGAEGEEEPAAEDGEGDAAAALATVRAIAEAAGVDEAAVLAGLEENIDKLAAMLAGAEPDGTEAEAEATREIANSRVAALSKQLTERDEELTKLRAQVAELDIDSRMARGELAGDRDKLVSLATTLGPDAFKAAVDALAAPTPPQGRKYKASKKAPTENDAAVPDFDSLDERTKGLAKIFMATGNSQRDAVRLALSNKGEN